jgi:hypothetical protein
MDLRCSIAASISVALTTSEGCLAPKIASNIAVSHIVDYDLAAASIALFRAFSTASLCVYPSS